MHTNHKKATWNVCNAKKRDPLYPFEVGYSCAPSFLRDLKFEELLAFSLVRFKISQTCHRYCKI